MTVSIYADPDPDSTGELTLKTEYALFSLFPDDMEMKAIDYENGILSVEITNHTEETISFDKQYTLAYEDGSGYSSMNRMIEEDEEAEMCALGSNETAELACDLRVFGKVKPGKYMLLVDEMQTVFELIEE